MAFLKIQERIAAVEYSNLHGIKQTAEKYKIHERTVKRYRAAYNKMKEFENPKRQRMSTPKISDKELILLEYVRQQRHQKLAVNGSVITSKLLMFNPQITDYHKTRKWVYNTLRKHKFTSRARTHVGQSVPDNAEDLHAAFISDYHQIIDEQSPEVIINMDETPVCFDTAYNRTFERKGARTVEILASKAAKKNVTCVLAVTSTGEKLPPLIIFKGSRTGRIARKLAAKDGMPNEGVYACNEKHWMTTKEMHTWIQKVLLPFVAGRKFLLIMDKFSVHQEQSVKDYLNTILNSRILFIPAGLTSLAQPLDLTVNRSFKSALRLFQCIQRSLILTVINRENLAHDIVNAWSNITPELIVNGFIKAGLQ